MSIGARFNSHTNHTITSWQKLTSQKIENLVPKTGYHFQFKITPKQGYKWDSQSNPTPTGTIFSDKDVDGYEMYYYNR